MRLLRHLTLLTLVFIAWPAPAQQYPARKRAKTVKDSGAKVD